MFYYKLTNLSVRPAVEEQQRPTADRRVMGADTAAVTGRAERSWHGG